MLNDRERAIQILRQARDELADQLTERVLELREAILDDAQGQSYMGEIEALYDQYGQRLAHLGAMIANLPAVPDPFEGTDDVGPDYEASCDADLAHAAYYGSSFLALPAPGTDTALYWSSTAEGAEASLTFFAFLRQVQLGDLDAAGQSLCELFAVDAHRGRRCAGIFAERMDADPLFLTKAIQLRRELASGNVNSSLMLLWQCFGLQGMESIEVMQTLKSRISSSA